VLPDGAPGDDREVEEILMHADLVRPDVMLPKPVPVKWRMLSCIHDGITHAFIDQGVKIAPLHGLDLRGIIPVLWH
jgi:hypothetical protein